MDMTPTFQSDDGRVTLYRGDCREIAPTLTGVEAIVADPPYGMDWPADGTRFCGGSDESKNKRGIGKDYGCQIEGDSDPFDPTPWLGYERVILWGMQHYGQRLPVGSVLVWIKRFDEAFGTFLSDADLAWMKGGHGVYCKRGPMPQSMAHDRNHPTEKPVALMAWCLEKAKVPADGLVLDPYMGSCPVGLACIRTGRHFIGIEIDPKHYAVAESRIRQELAQGILL